MLNSLPSCPSTYEGSFSTELEAAGFWAPSGLVRSHSMAGSMAPVICVNLDVAAIKYSKNSLPGRIKTRVGAQVDRATALS